jgi:hypothetical protein
MLMQNQNGNNRSDEEGQSSSGNFMLGVGDPPPLKIGTRSFVPIQFEHHTPRDNIQPSYVRVVPVPDKNLASKKKNTYDRGTSMDHLKGKSGIKWSQKNSPKKIGDFIQHRPAMRVQEVPGGPSSLGYIFGGE